MMTDLLRSVVQEWLNFLVDHVSFIDHIFMDPIFILEEMNMLKVKSKEALGLGVIHIFLKDRLHSLSSSLFLFFPRFKLDFDLCGL